MGADAAPTSGSRRATVAVVAFVAVLAVGLLVWGPVADRLGEDESAEPGAREDVGGSVEGEAVRATVAAGTGRDFGPAPDHPDGPWPETTMTAIEQSSEGILVGVNPTEQLRQLGDTGDARLAWVLADLLRFSPPGEAYETLVGVVQTLLPDAELTAFGAWGDTVDHLIAWDLPVPEGQYADVKRRFYGRIEPRWAELMTDGADIDWRLVTWGGVGIDDRDLGSVASCPCIPALDDPAVTPADGGDWYPDERLVFGVVVNGEARAYPKNIMEVHEMVNDTVGGRRIGMPYCTLCGSAQAYLLDELPDELVAEHGPPVLRTSGLLFRSNKMMYELRSRSFIDTFRGEATAGPLAEAGVTFDQVSVVTSTWADWKAAHPDTTIVAEDGGIGRFYELDPLRGRDDDGPIFPIGDVDPRLPVQEQVLGVVTGDGRPIAFHVAAAAEVLADGGRIEVEGIELRLDGGGIRALRDGEDASGHQAFWFAWSQFHPDTLIWPLDV